MNLTNSTSIFALLGLSLLTCSANANYFYHQADVVSTTPIFHTVEKSTPHQSCWQQPVYQERRYQESSTSATPMIVGAIVGGAIGNAVGHNKTNKRIGTVAGALLGGSIGHDIGKSGNTRVEYQQTYQTTCEVTHTTTETHQELVGYNVTYSYNGSTFTTRTNYDPGATLRIKVSVSPAQ